LTKLGRASSFVDGQIASIAQVNDLAVVTLNIDDYAIFEGIKLVDWRL
jgi:tRNA(fMet)-specific endonuclease VapC